MRREPSKPMIKFKSDILSDNNDKINAIYSNKKEKDFHEVADIIFIL